MSQFEDMIKKAVTLLKLRKSNPVDYYRYGHCDIFARVASKRFNKRIYAFLETRTVNINGLAVEGEGLVHAFLVINKDGLAFDAGGFTTIDEIRARYGMHKDNVLLTEVTPKYLIKLCYRKYDAEADRNYLRSAKKFIKHNFSRKDFRKPRKLI
jgi:hypothetical protein